MKMRNQAVRAAALAAAAVAVMMASSPAHAIMRDSDVSSRLGIGRAHQGSLDYRAGLATVRRDTARSARLSPAWGHPMVDWDYREVLPGPVVQIIGSF